MKVAIGFIGFILIGVLSVLVMIFGWGIEPVSWGWIVGGYLATAVIGAMFQGVE